MRRLPWILVLARAALAPVLVLLAFLGLRAVLVACLALGLLADVADGKIARRLGVATDALRRADSRADLLFWLAALVAACVLEPGGMRARAGWILLVLALEGATHALAWIRFGRGPSNHAYASKLWGLLLCASLVAIVAAGTFGWLFDLMIAVGLLSLVEGLAILALLPSWHRDVPSLRAALAIRRRERPDPGAR